MRLGWAIVGAGKLADMSIAPAIAEQPDSRLAAVYSRDLGRARTFAERHGGGSAYDDYKRLLADPGVDIVYIATPNALHPSQTLAALRAGKHVLVDKPIALGLADGREMVRTASDQRLLLGVGFHLRHKPSNIAAREAIAAGRLGRVFFAEIELSAGKSVFPYDTWRSELKLVGGGTVVNQGTHTIDLLRFVTGQNVVSVVASADHLPFEDVFGAVCTLEDGALGSLTSHQLYAGTRPDYVFFGEGGWIQGVTATQAVPNDSVVLRTPTGESLLGTSEASAFRYEVDDFVKAVLGQASLNGDGEDGLYNIAVVDAIYRSARLGQAAKVEPIW